ncbi:MAG: hypothetical protein KDK07_22615 [Bauldia sp.]|nr:hypothetical protein [Bauldia sp.]
MTPHTTATGEATRTAPRGAGAWLSLAAAPTFAAMALVTALDTGHGPICSVAGGALPIDGMTAMYGLMALFHAPPWLRRISRPRAPASA